MSVHGVVAGFRTNNPKCLNLLQQLPSERKWNLVPATEADIVFSLWAGSTTAKRRGVRQYNVAYINAVRIARTFELNKAVARLDENVEISICSLATQTSFFYANLFQRDDKLFLIFGLNRESYESLKKSGWFEVKSGNILGINNEGCLIDFIQGRALDLQPTHLIFIEQGEEGAESASEATLNMPAQAVVSIQLRLLNQRSIQNESLARIARLAKLTPAYTLNSYRQLDLPFAQETIK